MTIRNTIFNLIKNNDMNQVIKIINKNKNFNINIFNDNNISLLEFTITNNQLKLFKLLIEKNVNIDIIDNDGRTILYQMIKLNRLEFIDLILSYNDNKIGIDLLNIKDNYNDYCTHYSIIFNNLDALKILIKYNVKIDFVNNDGNNILHIAAIYKNFKIIRFLVKNFKQLNTFNHFGESTLNIAIVNNFPKNILKLLIDNFDFNKRDPNKLISPIITAILENNNFIYNNLETININYNLKDYKGNSFLQYCIIYENERYFDKIINNINMKKYNFNDVNIEGQTVLHSILYNVSFLKYTIKYDLFKKILKNTNLNIKDNLGNSCFLLICKYNIWEQYFYIIESQPINAFLQNHNNEKPIDFIKKENIDKFFNMITSSFFYYIKNKSKYKLSPSILKNCKKIDNKCKLFIKTFIKENSISNLPKKISYCHNVIDNNVTYVTFIGLQLDMFFGLHYLQKYKDVSTSLNLDVLSSNNKLIEFYNNNGICKNYKYEFPNLELKWTFQKLILTNNFKKLLNDNKIIICIPIAIILEEGSHSNMLIVDNIKKIIIRFEPYGSKYPFNFNYNPNLLDSELEKMILYTNDKYEYIPPKSYLKTLSFQAFENSESKDNSKIGDPGGFCAAWSLWFSENYILNYKKIDNLSEFIQELNLQIRVRNISFKNMIRTFAAKIAKYRDKYLKKINIDINDWNNESLTDDVYDNAIEYLNSIK